MFGKDARQAVTGFYGDIMPAAVLLGFNRNSFCSLKNALNRFVRDFYFYGFRERGFREIKR